MHGCETEKGAREGWIYNTFILLFFYKPQKMGNVVLQMEKKENRTHSWPIYQHVGQTAFIMCVSPAQVQDDSSDGVLLPYMINQIICNYHLELIFVEFTLDDSNRIRD